MKFVMLEEAWARNREEWMLELRVPGSYPVDFIGRELFV